MSKITKRRKKSIRADVLLAVANLLEGTKIEDLISVLDLDDEEKGLADNELLAIRCDLLNNAVRLRAVPADPDPTAGAVPITQDDQNFIDSKRPGIEEIRSELRRNGTPEELINSEAKVVWEFRHRNGPAPRGHEW